ncbi:hypothetical protein SELMODRAFT_430583 [Selaginella moellendorffii]|uniref:PROP1-like PPR domain-containing protein n=1 Tax=Selaginella moellendorffii TaxID=88036 RepID=D8T9V4_SELML|nr:hypothetical protein SELMODRAFT_430583 [Selaginella moellendorffii]
MALTALSSAHLLSIGSTSRSGLLRRDGIDDSFDGHCALSQTAIRRARQSFGEADRKPRDVRIRAQALSDAAQKSEYRNIAQINEAIRKAESVPGALKILEETKAAGVHTPNEATYASLMLACRKLGQGERALTIYEAMKQTKEPISIRTYNTLISCCQQALRMDDAFRVKKELEEAGVKPDVVTYTSLIDTVIRSTRIPPAQRFCDKSIVETCRLEKALQLYKEMQTLSITPDSKTYNTLIQAAGEAKATEKALELYQSLTKVGLSANSFTFDLLLKCLGSGGRLKVALQVYNEARAAGITLYTSTYNFLIGACATAPQPNAERAWAFYEEMKSKNLKVNALTFINLISASSKAADNAGVMKAFQLMKELDYTKSITTTTYNQILESASIANTLEDALKIYYEMKKAGYKPNVSTYSSLISACIRNKDFKQAQTLEEEEFKNVDVSLNQSVLHSLIRAYGDADKWEDSVRIFRDMIKKGMPLTEESFASVFEACFGREQITAMVASENKKFGITPRIEAGIQLYEEFALKKQFTNFSSTNLSRCDVKTMSLPGTIFAVLAWLKAVRANPPAADLIVVTGTINELDNTPGKPKYPKRHTLAMRTMRALRLPVMRLNTLAMLTLTTNNDAVQRWVRNADPFSATEGAAAVEEDDPANGSEEAEEEGKITQETVGEGEANEETTPTTTNGEAESDVADDGAVIIVEA